MRVNGAIARVAEYTQGVFSDVLGRALPNGWRVDSGTLTKPDGTEDILTTDQFGDFELAIDWRIGTGGNSGIFYRGSEEFERVYWRAAE